MSNVTTLQSNYNIITNNNLTIDNILETINNLPEAGSGEPILQEKTISPTVLKQTVIPDAGYDGFSQVTINEVTSSIDSNIVASNIKNGVSILGVTGTLEEGLFIDYSPDFNAPNTAITTQEITIDQIAAALEGKAAGSTEAGSGGDNLNQENISVTFNLQAGGREFAMAITSVKWDNGQLVPSTLLQDSENITSTLDIAKNQIIFITNGGATMPREMYTTDDTPFEKAHIYIDNVAHGPCLAFSLDESTTINMYCGNSIGGGANYPW